MEQQEEVKLEDHGVIIERWQIEYDTLAVARSTCYIKYGLGRPRLPNCIVFTPSDNRAIDIIKALGYFGNARDYRVRMIRTSSSTPIRYSPHDVDEDTFVLVQMNP